MRGIVTRIALRNLKEHRSKTLIVGIIITLGVAVMVVGNSFIDSVNAGIEESYIQKYTGNIIISSSQVESPSLSLSHELMEKASPVIPRFQELQAHVQSLPEVESTTGQINGVASIEWGDRGEGFSVLLGVDPLMYQETFPEGVNIVEGRFLEPDLQFWRTRPRLRGLPAEKEGNTGRALDQGVRSAAISGGPRRRTLHLG